MPGLSWRSSNLTLGAFPNDSEEIWNTRSPELLSLFLPARKPPFSRRLRLAAVSAHGRCAPVRMVRGTFGPSLLTTLRSLLRLALRENGPFQSTQTDHTPPQPTAMLVRSLRSLTALLIPRADSRHRGRSDRATATEVRKSHLPNTAEKRRSLRWPRDRELLLAGGPCSGYDPLRWRYSPPTRLGGVGR
jgi:hypothetical protein